MDEKELTIDTKKKIANIISVYGTDYDKTIRYIEYNNKYWIIWINKFLMYSNKEENFSTLRGMSEIDSDEINEFIKIFSK